MLITCGSTAKILSKSIKGINIIWICLNILVLVYCLVASVLKLFEKPRGCFWSCFIDDIIGWTFVFIYLATEDWHLCYYHFLGDIVPIRYLLMRLLSMMKTLLSSSVELKLFQALIEKVSIYTIWYSVVLNGWSCWQESVILSSLLLITCLKCFSFGWYSYWLCYNVCEWKIN